MPLYLVIQVLKSCLLILSALFPIVNPLGNSPIFLILTRDYSSEARALLSWKIAVNSYVLLLGSMLVGSHILAFFGISLPVVQVGGGLVIMSTSWTLLNQKEAEARAQAKKKVTTQDIANRAFYPLTLPLTVGPGSISVALTLGADQAPHQDSITRLIAVVVGPAVLALTIFLSYRFAENLARLLGETAMNVIVRLSSFILFCIGVQILWNGIRALLAGH